MAFSATFTRVNGDYWSDVPRILICSEGLSKILGVGREALGYQLRIVATEKKPAVIEGWFHAVCDNAYFKVNGEPYIVSDSLHRFCLLKKLIKRDDVKLGLFGSFWFSVNIVSKT